MRKSSRSRKDQKQFSFNFNKPSRLHDNSEILPPKFRRIRITSFGMIAVVWVLLVGMRLYVLQIKDNGVWQQWASKQHNSDIQLASERGPILDREGRLLAVSVPASSVYVRPKLIKDIDDTARKLGIVLQIDQKEIRKKLTETKPFVWLQRQLPREIADRVATLDIKGVNSVLESKRFYPYNNAASTLIGKVGIDGNGLSGIEKIQENSLHEQDRKQRVIKDAYGISIQLTGLNENEFELPKGSSVQLTIDTAIQQIVDEETELGAKITNAKAVTAVMVDADTGDILAMSQSKSPNFNSTDNDPENMKNKLVEAVFEPGSIFKPLVAAAAIEENLAKATDIINCEGGKYPFMGHLIKDVHPSGSIPFFDVVVRSSNIGMTKIGIRLGKDRLYDWIKRFGFGVNTKLGLPGETGGILRNVSTWSGVDVATHSFGQGVAVTPLQIVRAMSAIANGGKIPTLRIMTSNKAPAPERILSSKTANVVKEMMYGVVEDEHGTGGKAVIEGIRVGGKTGTAQKARADGKGYMSGAYVASFVGFVDTKEVGLTQNLVLAVIVDEARSNTIYGGTLAAPIFRRVMQRTVQSMVTKDQIGSSDDSEGGTRTKRNNSLYTPVTFKS